MLMPCRVSGCKGSDTSPVRLCDDHFGQLPRAMRVRLRGAVEKSRGMGEKYAGQILTPAIEEAMAHIEAQQSSLALFEDAEKGIS